MKVHWTNFLEFDSERGYFLNIPKNAKPLDENGTIYLLEEEPYETPQQLF